MALVVERDRRSRCLVAPECEQRTPKEHTNDKAKEGAFHLSVLVVTPRQNIYDSDIQLGHTHHCDPSQGASHEWVVQGCGRGPSVNACVGLDA